MFLPSKIQSLRYLVWLFLVAACTPPNYAPVKTVNQTFPPEQENPPVNPPKVITQSKHQTVLADKKSAPRLSAKTLQDQNTIDSKTKTVQTYQQPASKSRNRQLDNTKKQAVSIPNKLSKPSYSSSSIPEKQKPSISSQLSTEKLQKAISSARGKASHMSTAALTDTRSKNNNSHKSEVSSEIKNKEKKSIISNDNKKMLKLSFGWPLKGKIGRNFSQTDNMGIDINGKTGQTVRATESGKAVYCGHGLAGWGNLVIIKHDKTFLSAYANNSQLHIQEGQHVEKGQTIAQLGLAGHKKVFLHFEIRKNGKSVNPLTLLPRP